MGPIGFWFSVGSTYTWLGAVRVSRLMDQGGIVFDWRPYSTRTIMTEVGNLPKNAPVKLAYMWRDVERRARRLGLSPNLPAPYPLTEFELANRVATVGAQEGWCRDYLLATYRRWMEMGLPAGAEPNLSDSLREIGQDPAAVVARAKSDAVGAAFTETTDAARRLGIFGAPTFTVGEELFWGEDRLDDALAWARDGTLT